ncbi:MAG: hypothetical protein AB7J47_12460 [Acidimicrobiia bacterium]
MNGRGRHWLARSRNVRALLPVLVPFVATEILVWRLAEPLSWGCAALYAALVREAWWRWARVAYWRLRWPWDSRASGLTRFAERGVNLSYDSLGKDTLEVAPALIRLTIDEFANRTYVLRPLPGSTSGEYRIAGELLRTRWRAAGVQVLGDESASRFARGRVVVVVIVGKVIEEPLRLPAELLR